MFEELDSLNGEMQLFLYLIKGGSVQCTRVNKYVNVTKPIPETAKTPIKIQELLFVIDVKSLIMFSDCLNGYWCNKDFRETNIQTHASLTFSLKLQVTNIQYTGSGAK